MIERVIATDEARQWLLKLQKQHGPLLIHQSGGCCDGSAPMCYLKGEFRTGNSDVFLGTIEGVDIFIGKAQYKSWAHTQLILDVVPGRGSGFSLESPEGIRFLTRSRVFTDEELQELGIEKNN